MNKKNKHNKQNDLWAIDGTDLMQLQVATGMYVAGLEDGPYKQKLLDTLNRTRFANLTELNAPRE